MTGLAEPIAHKNRASVPIRSTSGDQGNQPSYAPDTDGSETGILGTGCPWHWLLSCLC